jgi:hypothetical protein
MEDVEGRLSDGGFTGRRQPKRDVIRIVVKNSRSVAQLLED